MVSLRCKLVESSLRSSRGDYRTLHRAIGEIMGLVDCQFTRDACLFSPFSLIPGVALLIRTKKSASVQEFLWPQRRDTGTLGRSRDLARMARSNRSTPIATGIPDRAPHKDRGKSDE